MKGLCVVGGFGERDEVRVKRKQRRKKSIKYRVKSNQ